MTTVGRLARKYGISRSTLLYYDRIGLLHPASHTRGEYRHYTEADEERLRLICAYREAGLSLQDIGIMLDSPGNTELQRILENRLDELRQKMDALRHQQRLVAGLLGRPELLDTPGPLSRETWSELLRTAGYSEADMRRWHRDFERMAPEKHDQFLRYLRIPEDEIALIRQ